MWTPTTRRQHSRDHLRYGSDLTDAEWEIIAPFLPSERRTGRPRRWPMREIMNAIFYVLRSGCPWRMVPDSFAPASTVYRWFVRLRDEAGERDPAQGVGLFCPLSANASIRLPGREAELDRRFKP